MNDALTRLTAALRDDGDFAGKHAVIARAPGRLDVMGGVADYSGALVCEMPLDVSAAVAVALRDDGHVVCRSAQAEEVVNVAMNDRDALHAQRWALYVAGCLWELLDRGAVCEGGVTIRLDSDVPLGGGVSSSAAIEVATMTALGRLLDLELPPLQRAVACQHVENHYVGAPCGVMDQVTSAMGQQGAMLRILCQPGADGLPAQVLGTTAVPEGCRFIGLHSGVRHEVSGDPYTDTRVAAFMGQRISETFGHLGCLAGIDAKTFRRSVAAQLPVAMTGRAFLDRYHHSNDTVTTINPDKTYNVRAAAEHGVLEHDRVTRFIRALGAGDHRRAGRLMLASHHSYGLRANLGDALTDRLVAMAMRIEGVYGAKITGGGCGGAIAIFMRDEPAVHDAVASMRETYERETGRATTLFAASGPGAQVVHEGVTS